MASATGPCPGASSARPPTNAEYHELTVKTGIPFVPDAAWKDAVFAAAIIFAVMACAFFFGPFGPTGTPDPTIIQTVPKPDFAFLWIYSVLAFLPASLETPALLIAPVVIIAAMLLLPVLAGEGERHWTRRPVAVLTVSVIAVTLGIFTHLGTYTPWSPIMDAWTSAPVPAQYLHDRTPLERQGALVLQNKQCRDCHALGGIGGQRGPSLDSVASRMTEDQMIRQVLQGGGNMPAYGNALNPSETKALMQFLMTLRGGLAPAVDASRELTHADQTQPPQSALPAPAAHQKPPSLMQESEAARAIFSDWSPPVGLTLALILTAAIYIRGWSAIRRTRRAQFTDLRLMSFLGGLALFWLAVASPLDGFADTLLTVHMVEHLLLMSAIPMLLLYSLPVVPLLRGLPAPVVAVDRRADAACARLRRFAHWLVTPAIAWLAMNLGYLLWHVPAAYDLALENEAWHRVEHLCFLGTSLLFWWVILRPWPAQKRPADWGALIYLALADIVMTMLSGFLTFCDRPVYPYYVNHPNPFGLPVLEDQVLGAVVMWVLGSFAFLVPAMIITLRLLSPSRGRHGWL